MPIGHEWRVLGSHLRQRSGVPPADNKGVDLTIAIPSRGRIGQLTRLLTALTRQTLHAHRFEVLVGLDGEASPVSHPRARILRLQHRGPAATRNTLVAIAQGEVILFLNDDVIPEPDLAERHLAAHRELGPADLVLGSAPWVVPEGDTLFDRLIRETSLIFFYDAMNEVERDRDWGFRHAWTLNLSLRTDIARQCPFDERLRRAMFEDLEWGYRLALSHGSRVLYRPGARVTHDHRYTPADYLARERRLGAEALTLAAVNPACAEAIFRRDIRDAEFVRECRRLIAQEQEVAFVLEREFLDLAHAPVSAGAHSGADIPALYQRFVPLKRHWWRQGLVEAAARAPGLGSTWAA